MIFSFGERINNIYSWKIDVADEGRAKKILHVGILMRGKLYPITAIRISGSDCFWG